MRTHTAEQLYTFADLVRLLKVGEDRLRAMRDRNELLPPDIIVPGGGHKAARWSASRVAAIQRSWSVLPEAAGSIRD
jgi:hypothetical protein